jgi:hypothetical protein
MPGVMRVQDAHSPRLVSRHRLTEVGIKLQSRCPAHCLTLSGSHSAPLLHLLKTLSHPKLQLLSETLSNVTLLCYKPWSSDKLSWSPLEKGTPWEVPMNTDLRI